MSLIVVTAWIEVATDGDGTARRGGVDAGENRNGRNVYCVEGRCARSGRENVVKERPCDKEILHRRACSWEHREVVSHCAHSLDTRYLRGASKGINIGLALLAPCGWLSTLWPECGGGSVHALAKHWSPPMTGELVFSAL